MAEPIGVTLNLVDGQDSVAVYQDDTGLDVFSADAPYLLSDGVSLQAPMPIFDAGASVYIDSMGNAQSALGVNGLSPESGITWDSGQTWDNGTFWS